MAKPITIPNTFASATSAIPLSQLDQDFSTLANATNDLATYSNYVADTGAADAYIANFPANTNTASLTAGLTVQFKAANANTGASTLNVQVNGSTIGTASIRYANGSSLAAGAIAAGALVSVMYDGTNFQLINDPAGQSGGDVTGPASATDNAIARFDGASGKLIQNSVVTIADTTGDMSGVGTLSAGNVTVSGTANAATLIVTGNSTLGDASGDTLTINGTTVTTPNGLNFDSNTFVIDATNNRIGVNNATPTTALDVTGTATISTNLAFTGTGNRITGDMSNGTLSNRFAFQTSTTNGNTSVQVIPNGTGNTSNFRVFNSSDPNNAAYLSLQAGAAEAIINSTALGTGTSLPLTIYTAGIERLRIDTSGNVGIGTSSPNTKLQVVTSVGSSDGIEIANASGASRRRLLMAVDGIGGYIDSYNFSGSAGAFLSLNPNGGNVGVGTSSPAQKLHVVSGTSTYVQVQNTGNSINAYYGVDTGGGWMGTGSNHYAAFYTNNTERMRIDSSGNVMIGTATALGAFNVVSGANYFFIGNSASSSFTSGAFGPRPANDGFCSVSYNWSTVGSGNFWVNDISTGNFSWQRYASSVSGGVFMTLDSTGRLGIGTSSPAAKLNVGRAGTIGVLTGVNAVFNADSNNAFGGIQINSFDDNTKRFAIINNNGVTSLFGYGSNSSINLGTDNAQPVLISTNNTERMRIDSSGNVGIGTSSIGAKLQVISGGTPITSGLGYGGMVVQNNGNVLFDAASYVVGGSSGNSRFIGGFSTGASNLTIVAEFYADNASTRSCVRTNQSNGVFLASGGTSWGSLSDERAKTDLNPITNAVNKVTQLRAVTGRYKTDEEGISRSFLIAQDVQAVLPEAISIDNEGNLGLQYTDTIPLLVAAIKEQQAMIEELKQEVALLKSK